MIRFEWHESNQRKWNWKEDSLTNIKRPKEGKILWEANIAEEGHPRGLPEPTNLIGPEVN